MLFNEVFERFVDESPVCVMAPGLVERALSCQSLDAMFEATAQHQYTKDLLFSTTVDLMASVVCRMQPSVHSAYQAKKKEITVAVKSLYNKLECMEPTLSSELVKHTGERLDPIIRQMKGTMPPLLKGYAVKILDGNHLASTERRLKILRDVAAGALPGQSLVVLEPETGLATHVICCEDGHTQERKLLEQIHPLVKKDDLWIADRNFCTTNFLYAVVAKQGSFILRQHGSTLQWEKESEQRRVGQTSTGTLYERKLWLQDENGKEMMVRQITLKLKKPTRDGESEIRMLTNLPKKIPAEKVSELYRKRWTIEGLFQRLTEHLKCEVNTLGYPKAALFGFCVALAANNVLAGVKAALRATHKKVALDETVSDYFLAEELAGTYRGMMIALPSAEWKQLSEMSDRDFIAWLTAIAKRVKLDRYPKSRRGEKKPRPRRTRHAQAKHVATTRLIKEEKGEI